MGDIAAVRAELNKMLDDGVEIDVLDQGGGSFGLRVQASDSACAECLVPDTTLAAIATDSLQRQGIEVSAVHVEH